MENRVFTNPSYALTPNFRVENNVGNYLINVGLPNQHYDALKALLAQAPDFKVHELSAEQRNVETPTGIISWVEVKFIAIPVDTNGKYGVSLIGGLRTICGTAPFTIAVLDCTQMNLDQPFVFYSADNRDVTGVIDLYYPEGGFIFEGVVAKQKPQPDDLIAWVSIHTSKELPVNYMMLEAKYVESRQSSVLQLSPAFNSPHQLTGYAFGMTGADLLEEIKADSLFGDLIPASTVMNLFSMSRLGQYRTALVLRAWRNVYGKLSREVICSIIDSPSYYSEIVDMIESGIYPSREQLHELFSQTPAVPAGWNMG